MWQAWINLILGAWLFLSGIINGLNVNVNYIIVGVLVAILGFWAYRKWQSIFIGIIGCWLILSGFVVSLIAPWNAIIMGIIIVVLAAWQLMAKPHIAVVPK